MTNLNDLLQQREALDQQIKQARKQQFADAIAQVRALIHEHQLTAQDVFSSTRKSAKSSVGSKVAPAWGSVGVKRTEPAVWLADTDKTRQIGWQAAIDLREGLRRTIEWEKRRV